MGLIKNLTVASKILTLDLNGHSISGSSEPQFFVVSSGSTFNLYDTVGNGKLVGNYIPTHPNQNGITVQGSGSTFNMYNGTITGCRGGSTGGGVIVTDEGTFNMYNGTITGCNVTTNGGGVFVNETSTFNMYNGTITGCNASTNGGGVWIDETSTFNVRGSVTITDNTNSTAAVNNVYLANSERLHLVGDLNGRIGINYNGEIPASTKKFGTAAGKYNGAENFVADYANLKLAGSINGNTLEWQSYVEVKNWNELVTAIEEWQDKENPRTIVLTNASEGAYMNMTGTAGAYAGIPVTGKITIKPSSSAGVSEIKVDANQMGRLFNVAKTGNLTLVGNGAAVLNLTGGNWTPNGDAYGGAILVTGGNLTLNGGAKITYSKVKRIGQTDAKCGGGAVALLQGARFTMNGDASIANCTSNNDGGAVNLGYNDDGGTQFTMNDYSTITNCTAIGYQGGAIYCSYKNTVIMNDHSSITDCVAKGERLTGEPMGGGGIRAYGSIFMNDYSSISNCTVTSSVGWPAYGGGILVGHEKRDGKLEMTGNSIITGCTADDYGGGVYVKRGAFNVSGNAEVTGNTVNGVATNVHLYTNSSLNLVGPFAGSIGIANVSGAVPALGAQFGKFIAGSGAGNFFADNNHYLVGSISDSNLVWIDTTPTPTPYTPSHKESGQTVIQQQVPVQDVSVDPTPANQATADISVKYVSQSVIGTSTSDIAAIKQLSAEAAAQMEIMLSTAQAAGIPLTNSKGAKAVVVTDQNIPGVEKVTFSRVYEISPANEGEKLTKVTVKVPKSDITAKGLTSDDVTIYHYLETYNIWQPLETLSVSQDADNYYYTAATDGTSPFGVLVKKIGSDTTTPTTQPTQKSPAPFAGLVLGLGAAAVLLRFRR